METLDDVFGPKEDPPELPPRMTADELLAVSLSVKTEWRCPERLRLTLEAFEEAWPALVPRSTKLKRSIVISAEDVVNELGELEAPAFMRWAATVIHNDMPTLTIKDCRSVLFLAGKWRERERPDPTKWWSTHCKKCFTVHHPDGPCDGEEDEDE